MACAVAARGVNSMPCVVALAALAGRLVRLVR